MCPGKGPHRQDREPPALRYRPDPPADFVDPDMATGMVMSVPAHCTVRLHCAPRPPAAGEVYADQPCPSHLGRGLRQGPGAGRSGTGRDQAPDGQPDGYPHAGDLLCGVLEGKLFRKFGGKPVKGRPRRDGAGDARQVRLSRHVRVRPAPRCLPAAATRSR